MTFRNYKSLQIFLKSFIQLYLTNLAKNMARIISMDYGLSDTFSSEKSNLSEHYSNKNEDKLNSSVACKLIIKTESIVAKNREIFNSSIPCLQLTNSQSLQ